MNKKLTGYRLGTTGQKILLLLFAGASLSLAGRPDKYFKITKSVIKEWQKINRRSLYNAIRNLYKSQMIDYKENQDGTITIAISDNGKIRLLKYDTENIKIERMKKWDELWRVVIFDIPENKKRARNLFALKIKNMGMFPLQKSVFVSPYECKNEIDFITEILEIKPYVRFLIVKEIDIALDLKQKFNLI